MTPKEKAKELVDKFDIDVLDREGTSAMNLYEAKQCALIAVDEILNAVHIAQTDIIEYYKYWEQVKKEIEEL
jgi:hypothetical protein